MWPPLVPGLTYYLIILLTYYPNILLSCNWITVSAWLQERSNITGTEFLSRCTEGDRNSRCYIPLSSLMKRGPPRWSEPNWRAQRSVKSASDSSSITWR